MTQPTQAQIEAALEAYRKDTKRGIDQWGAISAALAVAAEVGDANLREDYKNMTASRDRLWNENHEIKAATVERCAQVVIEWLIRFQKDFAQDEVLTCSNIVSRIANLVAAIRALKDQP